MAPGSLREDSNEEIFPVFPPTVRGFHLTLPVGTLEWLIAVPPTARYLYRVLVYYLTVGPKGPKGDDGLQSYTCSG